MLKTVMAGAAAFMCSVGLGWAQARVVTLGGDMTEIVYALGAGYKLVATDDQSLFPEPAKALPKVGYVRRLSAEGVLSVEPDLLLISGAARPQSALDQITASGVDIVSVETEYTPEIILKKIDVVAEALGLEAEGKAYAAKVQADIDDYKARVDALGVSPKALFFASVPGGAPRAAGDNTAAGGVIEMLGGTNVFAGQEGYKSLSLEAAVAADPDIILVMIHHAEREGGIEAVRNHPAIALTRPAQEGMIFLVDQYTVMQFGPRAPAAVADLAEEIAEKLGDD
ncbi:MAG: ABC transporter substrate-binding protein [Pseudomonadota bacterium]